MPVQPTNRPKRAARALLCYVLALAVGFLCMGSPFIVLLAAPRESVAAAQQGDDGKGPSTEGSGTEGADDAPSKVQPEKISLKAYRAVPADGYLWDIDGGSTKTIDANDRCLRLLVTTTWDDGRRISEAEEAWDERGGFSQGFNYTSSDESVITVDPIGVLTAHDNGEATITVTPKNEDEAYQALSASITIEAVNQGVGLIVTKLQIVNEKNEPYGDDPIKLTKISQAVKLYARVTYRDKTENEKRVVYSNAPGAPKKERPQEGDEYTSVEDAFKMLNWQAGDSQYVSVLNRKGVATIKALANSTTRIYATITGGDSTKNKGFGPGVVYDSAVVNINNGKTIDGQNPAKELNVKVVYEQDVKTVLKEKTYSVKQFEKLGAIKRTYTLTQGKGKYVTDRAYGVPLATLLQDLGIATNDIAYFRLAANDGANPGRLSAKYLLKTTRYYLPNYDIGGSWQDKEQVPTMIALKDSWNANTQVTGEMNSGTRFRLIFGSATSADSATDKSIKYINTITVVMNGAPPVEHGDAAKKEKKHKKKKKKQQGGSGGGSGDNPGAGTSGSGGGTGAVQGNSNSEGEETGVGEETGEEAAEDASAPWRIFEMMNKSMSDLVAQYEDNPFLPYLLPAMGLVIIAAATARYAMFRRRLR